MTANLGESTPLMSRTNGSEWQPVMTGGRNGSNNDNNNVNRRRNGFQVRKKKRTLGVLRVVGLLVLEIVSFFRFAFTYLFVP